MLQFDEDATYTETAIPGNELAYLRADETSIQYRRRLSPEERRRVHHILDSEYEHIIGVTDGTADHFTVIAYNSPERPNPSYYHIDNVNATAEPVVSPQLTPCGTFMLSCFAKVGICGACTGLGCPSPACIICLVHLCGAAAAPCIAFIELCL